MKIKNKIIEKRKGVKKREEEKNRKNKVLKNKSMQKMHHLFC